MATRRKRQTGRPRRVTEAPAGYRRLVEGLMDDFFEELAHQKREAERNNRRALPFIRTLDDLARAMTLWLLLAEFSDGQETRAPLSEQDKLLEELIRTDPEMQELIAETFRRLHRHDK
jgi:hypothetical protein